MLTTARRIAWLILILGLLAALAAAIITLGNLADNFLTFSLTQLFWMGVLYVVVGVVLLILLRAERTLAVEAAAHARPAYSQAVRTISSANMQPDPEDLLIIEGIGPKSKEALNDAGILTFEQLAAKTPEELLRIVRDERGVQVVGNATATWTKQARYIINGDMEGLKKYQEFLQAGRE
jgi:predicted flap endonuclease-1-like 5' DNA nuclease